MSSILWIGLITVLTVFGIVLTDDINANENIQLKVFFDDELNSTTIDGREITVIDDEEILLPKKIPKITWKEKEALILASGIKLEEIKERKRKRRIRVLRKSSVKKRRSLSDAPWRRRYVHGSIKPLGPPVAADIHECPAKITAVTEAHNKRTYVFAGEYVYQIYRDRTGLQQKSAFLITDMFPAGPRTVSAALTNLRSAVTVLVDYKTVYRFRWSRKNQRFYLARKSPQKLDRNITFVPKLAFQWSDGNMILSDGNEFSTYDPYWNVATFTGKTLDYFPGIPTNAVGLAHDGGRTYMWMNEKAGLIIYDMKKYRIVQEYPVRINDYVACLSNYKKQIKKKG